MFADLRTYLDRLRRDDDLVTVETRTLSLRAATVSLEQRVTLGEALLATLRVDLACLEKHSMRPRRIPEPWRTALALAQGINKTAKYDAKLIRTTPAGRAETALPLKKILANAAADPKLQDGDILFVPVSGAKQFADKGVSSILQMAVGVVIYGRL